MGNFVLFLQSIGWGALGGLMFYMTVNFMRMQRELAKIKEDINSLYKDHLAVVSQVYRDRATTVPVSVIEAKVPAKRMGRPRKNPSN